MELTQTGVSRGADSGTSLPFGVLAYTGAGISLGFCFAQVIVLYALAVFGITLAEFNFNPHLQSILMWLFALAAVVGLYLDRKRCASRIPTMMGVVSFLIIIGTLYGRYYTPVLMMGYTVLLAAAFINQGFRLRQLNRVVSQQANSLQTLNATLEQRVQTQVREIESLGRLKRFLAPAVAELLINDGDNSRLDSHRRHIAALFCDIRGFTPFSESMEPEEVLGVLRAYHESMGRLIAKFEATIDHRAGDGLMVFFNDPIPCELPELQAVKLAVEMRDAFAQLNTRWQKLGYELGFGIGITSGFATMGIVGFEGRFDYTANGNVVNLASRLCDHANNEQILVSQRVLIEVEEYVASTPVNNLRLKGVRNPVIAHNIDALLAPID